MNDDESTQSGIGNGPERARVLYADADADERAALARYVEDRTTVTLRTAADGSTAIEAIESHEFDCLVVGNSIDEEPWQRLHSKVDVPLVVYAHPGEVPRERRRKATTIVERGNGESSRQFLVKKVETVTTGGKTGVPTTNVEDADRHDILELLVERAQDGLYTLDERGVIDFCNESFARTLGYEREEVIGSHVNRFESEADLLRGQRLVAELLDSERNSDTIEVTLYDSEGDPIEMSINFTVLTDDGEYAGLVGVARDITERKARERDLERYRRLVESAGDPMVVFNADWAVRVCNGALAACVDRSKRSLRGIALNALFPTPAAQRIRDTAGELGDEEWATCDITLQHAVGDQRLYEVTIGQLGVDDGGGAVVTMHDVTERERRADELDVLKQVLTRVLRHDVRSGLTVIRGQAEVLRDRVPEQADLAETIIERSEDLVETTEKARAIERVLSSDDGRTTLTLRPLVNRAVANVAAAHPDAEYDVEVASEIPVRVHHAFPYAIEDLVENAIVHNDSDPPRVDVTAADEEWIELVISDNGPGIPDDEVEVLERGEETPLKHGSGVGLWLVNWVVDRSGGTLSFENQDTTTAIVRLERGSAAAVAAGTDQPQRVPDLNGEIPLDADGGTSSATDRGG